MHACERGWSRDLQRATRHGLLLTEQGSGDFCCENNLLRKRQDG